MADDPEQYRTTVLVEFNHEEFESLAQGMDWVRERFGLELINEVPTYAKRSTWPIVGLTGTKAKVRQACLEYFGYTKDELKDDPALNF